MSLEIVTRVRNKYPTPLADQHPQFLLEVAAALGKGLLKKNGGSRIFLPDGQGVSQDCVMEHDGRHWDILSDGEGSAKPTWDFLQNEDGTPYLTDPNNYYVVEPTVPGDGNAGGGGTGNGGVSVDLQPLIDVLNDVQTVVTQLSARQDDMDVTLHDIKAKLDMTHSDLNEDIARVEELVTNPPAYTGRLAFSGPMRFTPEAKKVSTLLPETEDA